jgi:hypothetical protein
MFLLFNYIKHRLDISSYEHENYFVAVDYLLISMSLEVRSG